MREKCNVAVLAALFVVVPNPVGAQSMAESAATTANASVAVQTAKAPSLAAPAEPQKDGEAARKAEATEATKNASPNLVTPGGPPPAEKNRKALESDAGKHPAKLLLRSTPGNAEVFVNDLTVGRAPLLLIVAPGKYKVGMRGDHQEWGDQTVGVMADETQVVLIHLKARYPSSVTLH